MGISAVGRSGWGDFGGSPVAQSLIYQYLSTNGDGTGTTQMTGDYSGAGDEEFYIENTSPRKDIFLNRMIVSYNDTGSITALTYGCGITLAEGIKVEIQDADGVVLKDMLGGVPVIYNESWAQICYDVRVGEALGANKIFGLRWTFGKSGSPAVLKPGQKLVMTCRDNMSGLLLHSAMVQGYQA